MGRTAQLEGVIDVAERKPSAAKVLFSVGALMWLIPIVLILGALFVAILYAAMGWVGIVGGAIIIVLFLGLLIR